MKTFAIVVLSLYLLACGVLVPGYWFTARAKRAKLKRGSEHMRRDYDILRKKQTEFNLLVDKLREAQDEIDRQKAEIDKEKQELESLRITTINEAADLADKITKSREILNKYENKIKIIEQAATTRTEYEKNLEKAWERQIDLNNLPENISLRDRNRKSFFFYMFVHKKDSPHSSTIVSEPFGNAHDAKIFRDSLTEIFGENGYIRERDKRGEFEVWFENVDNESMREFCNEKTNRLKFLNPAFDESSNNHDIVSDEDNLMNAIEIDGSYDTGEEYEEYVAQRLFSMGFANVALTPASNDYGADVICEKDGVKYCVQCKMYSNPVGVSAVQEIVTAKAHYQCERAMVITNNVFTAQAKKLASENAVILVDEFT